MYGRTNFCLANTGVEFGAVKFEHRPFRKGDARQSVADISLAPDELGYRPVCGIAEGIEITMRWYFAWAQGNSTALQQWEDDVAGR